MISKGNKRAFTLAEIMIVVLILTIIFAVMAPILTKKMTRSTTNVWNWVRPLAQLNASYYQADGKKTAQAFFGITPGTTASEVFEPYSKVIIRSDNLGNNIQKQIHFRYGYLPLYNNPSQERKDLIMNIGEDSGSWLMDTKNILIGGNYPNLLAIGNNNPEYSNTNTDYPYNNISLGNFALNGINNQVDNKIKNNIAIGYSSGQRAQNSENNLFIGYNADNISQSANGETIIGARAGETHTGTSNTIIGYYAGGNTSGYNNIYVGYYAGKAPENAPNISRNNVGIGFAAIGRAELKPSAPPSMGNEYEKQDVSNNVAIGSQALEHLVKGKNNIAIGYKACRDLISADNKICIGANSGPNTGKTYPFTIESYGTDAEGIERIYLGGNEDSVFHRSILEIHNSNKDVKKLGHYDDTKTFSLNNFPDIVGRNATTIVNGNLIVRGRTFFTVGDFLYNFRRTDDGYEGGGLDASGNEENILCSENPLSYTFGGISDSVAVCPRVDITQTTSDRRLKNIGSKSTAGLKEVQKLKVFDYIFKDDKNKTPQIGVIAQDLMKVFPNSVMKNKDGFLSIKLDEMFFAAINALKELDKKLVTLAKRLTRVESTITNLEKENSVLKTEVANLTVRINKIKASRGL